RNKEFFVDTLDKSNPTGKTFRVNTKKICAVNEFYTFDPLPEEYKRWLERYYANHIEVLYNDIYKVFLNQNIDEISEDLKFKMLIYIISQELRTTKITTAMNNLFGRMLEYSYSAFEQLGIEKKIGLENSDIVN